jgi:hypothetical protein
MLAAPGVGWVAVCWCGREHRAAVPSSGAGPADFGRAWLAARAMAEQCPGFGPGAVSLWHQVTVPEEIPRRPPWAHAPCVWGCGISTGACLDTCNPDEPS